MSNRYEFVGGSLDGKMIEIEGDLYPGMQWPTDPGTNGKREIYLYDNDQKFRFARYSLPLNLKLYRSDAIRELQPVYEKLGKLFTELDEIMDKHGGPDNGGITIGNWTLKHKEA